MSKRFARPADQLMVVESIPENNELTIRGLLMVLKRGRSIILLGVSACFLLGIVACFFLKPRYKSLGEIEIQKSATDGVGLQNLTNPLQEGEQSDALDASITLQTQSTILQSSSLALKVIEDLNLDNTADFKPTFSPIGWALSLLTPSGVAADPRSARLEDSPHRRDHAVKVFAKRLKITPQSGTR